jgi:hypothetical protein
MDWYRFQHQTVPVTPATASKEQNSTRKVLNLEVTVGCFSSVSCTGSIPHSPPRYHFYGFLPQGGEYQTGGIVNVQIHR